MKNLLQRKYLPDPQIPIKEEILSRIDIKSFYGQYVDGDIKIGSNIPCPFPGHDDRNASFHVRHDGSFRCFGCDESGSNPIEFYRLMTGYDWKQSCDKLYRETHNVIPNKEIEDNHKRLLSNRDAMEFLKVARGWHEEIIKDNKIGLTHGTNDIPLIAIPRLNTYGYFDSLKLYNYSGRESHPKFKFDQRFSKEARPWPYHPFVLSDIIYLFEGEPDCMLALSIGLPATTFGSANDWKDSWKKLFHKKKVIICYDDDEAGKNGSRIVVSKIASEVRSLKVIKFDKEDFTDFMRSTNFNKSTFSNLVEETSYHVIHSEEAASLDVGSIGKLNFTDSVNAENYRKLSEVIVMVSGKEPSPIMIPENITIRCQDKKSPSKCETCALADNDDYMKHFHIDQFFPDMLKWAHCTQKEASKTYRESLGINTRCRVDIEVEKMRNIEKVILTTPVKFGKSDNGTERRIGYFLGNGVVTNRHYCANMYSTQHPTNNSVVHIVTSINPLETELDSYVPTKEIHISLMSFQTNNIGAKLQEFHEIFSKNVTRIWNRPLLHIAADLPFFSVNSFFFAGEFIKRGSLDVLIFGDQRCGKGKVTEGLANYYRFGEIVSGENISFMNLVGGIEKSDIFQGLKWGRLVANDRGVVIIDEFSSLEKQTIGRLSRIRSEALAEIDKYGIHSKANARCSTICLSNTRDLPIGSYNFGCEALRSLIGQNEDIARFDYILAVEAGEVESEKINTYFEPVKDSYGSTLHKDLILWCKTRTSEQVRFTESAVQAAYNESNKFEKEYSKEIPILQVENSRIKLAKIASSIAGRFYSCDETGQILVVKREHIEYAASFLRSIYNNQTMSYHEYSNMVFAARSVPTESMAASISDVPDDVLNQFVYGMLQLQYITMNDIQDLTGYHPYEAKKLLGKMTRLGALKRGSRGYIKTTGFKSFVKMKLKEFPR